MVITNIYIIKNNITDKVYVGQTVQSIEKRFKKHITLHLNDETLLHRTMKIIGIKNFWIELIEQVPDEVANEREYYWIKYYYDKGLSYNEKISIGKCGGDTLSHHSNIKEISQKLSKGKLREKNPNATPVIAINNKKRIKILFWSFKECQEALNIPRHDIIGRRCSGKIKTLYLNEWMFKYVS